MAYGRFPRVDTCLNAFKKQIKTIDMEVVQMDENGMVFQGCGVLVKTDVLCFYEVHLVYVICNDEFYGVEMFAYLAK